jgi:hypothetical protein
MKIQKQKQDLERKKKEIELFKAQQQQIAERHASMLNYLNAHRENSKKEFFEQRKERKKKEKLNKIM